MQQKLFDLLKEENKKGKTILFSSHILSEVQKMCDRVAIIKEGRLVKLEKISTLRENNHKKFKLETKAPLTNLTIDGVTNFEVKDNITSFLYSGNINLILKKLSEFELENLWIDEPDLEEIFMHYYEKEN